MNDDITVTDGNATEIGGFRWVAEASDLGLAPGQWPTQLSTNLGNKQPFVLAGTDRNGTRHYGQAAGCLSLAVLND